MTDNSSEIGTDQRLGASDSRSQPTSHPSSPGLDQKVVFDAILHPHRSLSPQGFAILMGIIATTSAVVGGYFFMIGAWPIFGFLGLDVLLLYLAFRSNYRAARHYETVRLTEDTLIVSRHPVDGNPQEWRFQPHWLRVTMDDPPQHESQIRLISHGRALIVGSFLSPEERLDFAKALQTALARVRQPNAGVVPG